ncbi:MAG: NAD(P)-dependent oxidoreductase, partial [Victivallaceae bacterium]
AMNRGIRYCHCPKAMGYCVAEFTVGLMLSLGYEIGYFDRLIRDGHRSDPPEGEYHKRGGFAAKSLRYAEVGLIGSGNIARHVIRMLAPFDCKISVYDPFLAAEEAKKLGVKKVAKLETLLKKADILSVHAGWTKDTAGMLSAEKLALLKDDAMIICTARMPIFDEAALKREALSGRLRVALNLIPENPIWFEDDLRVVRKLLLSPGSASVSHSTWLDMGKMLLGDVMRFAERGKLCYEVKPSDLAKMT